MLISYNIASLTTIDLRACRLKVRYDKDPTGEHYVTVTACGHDTTADRQTIENCEQSTDYNRTVLTESVMYYDDMFYRNVLELF